MSMTPSFCPPNNSSCSRRKDGVIDIGRTAGTESADLIGDGSLVFGEGHAELGVGGKGEKGDFVVGFERSESRVGGVSQRRSEEHTSELQSLTNLVCRLLLEKKKK